MTKCAWHLCENKARIKFCSNGCKSKYYTKRRRRKLKELAVKYKGGCCEVCGYDGKRCLDVMEFHHRDPTKKDFGIGQSGETRAWEAIQSELDKCMLLCCRCHREGHAGIIDIS